MPFFLIILLSAAPPSVLAQDSGGISIADIDALRAAESFRLGVEAYNRNSFNEAIFALEQALSLKPDEALILDWLGRAYCRSGMENIAIRQWQRAAEIYGTSSPEALLLNGRIERINLRRFPLAVETSRYVEIGRFPGSSGEVTVFSQPASVLPERDGSLWVAAYGSNEVVRLDVNGIVRYRERGPLTGFDRPFALARGLDGRIYVSEFRGGRISVLDPSGRWLSHIGSKGLAPGQLSGPAALAVDGEGYLYVAEFGNRRISKFDPDGAFISAFGLKSSEFGGFLALSGIAARDGLVYAADSVEKRIYTFDSNGRYMGELVSEGLEAPENLRLLKDGRLLVTDTKRLLVADPDTGITRVLYSLGNSRGRLIDGIIDANGGLMAADFDSNEIAAFTSLDDMASGLFVYIDRVTSDNYPAVTVELRVEDIRRNPITGLDATNFILAEEGRPVANQTFIAAGNAAAGADITVLLERSPDAAALRETFAAALRDITAAADGAGSIVSIVSAGEQPERERFSAENSSSIEAAARGRDGSYTPRWRFDLGLRLAATDLLGRSPKRAVLFVGSGKGLGGLAFEQYSLNELAAYMANNGIVFHAILADGGTADSPVSEEIRYLCSETGGSAVRLYRPEGIAPLIKNLVSAPSGTYVLGYTSSLSPDFGRAFLPVEAEVYLLERSGRDSGGYFSPTD
ncbi:MAG: NHL repeat-containing protein [Spirochaetaceae bacterium]|nr:NHL repeat-containing protein [Spirochaetaceae bacterium]